MFSFNQMLPGPGKQHRLCFCFCGFDMIIFIPISELYSDKPNSSPSSIRYIYDFYHLSIDCYLIPEGFVTGADFTGNTMVGVGKS